MTCSTGQKRVRHRYRYNMFQHNNNNTRGNYYILPVIKLHSFAKTKRNAQLANNEKNVNAVEKTDRKKKNY